MLLVWVQGLERMREEGREIPHKANVRVLARQCEWREGFCRGGSCNQWLGEKKWCVLGMLCRFIPVLFILVLIHLLIFVVFPDLSVIKIPFYSLFRKDCPMHFFFFFLAMRVVS